MDWISFWDGSHAIYTSERHKQVHYARIAADIARFVPTPTARVLDYGCGEALGAAALANACASLTLSDAAPGVRQGLKARLAQTPRIQVLSPEEVAALPDGSFDLIVANSLLQYLSPQVRDDLMALWRRLLSADGTLLIADVIPPHVSAVRDAAALLRFGAAEGFLGSAILGLVRTVFSPYRKLRADLGLSQYSEAEMLDVLTRAGFTPRRVQPNVGHNQERMAFTATRRA
jgi:SAM-dependent methyltransferase